MALKEIEIILNGLKETIREGASIAQLIEITNECDKSLIVELNGKFVFAQEYSITFLNEGDRVEFINAAYGG
jgi:thiamine biosynthesis protein ThiS